MKAADTCIKKEDRNFLKEKYPLAEAQQIIYLTGQGEIFKQLVSSSVMTYFYYRVLKILNLLIFIVSIRLHHREKHQSLLNPRKPLRSKPIRREKCDLQAVQRHH